MMSLLPSIHHQTAATADCTLAYGEQGFRLATADGDYALTHRAQKTIASSLELTPRGLKARLARGPLKISDHLRMDIPTYQMAIEDTTVLALDQSVPLQIDADGVRSALNIAGFDITDLSVCNGVLTASLLTSTPTLIADEVFRTGITARVDLTGFGLPILYDYVERQICKNGQTASFTADDHHSIPLYATSGEVNATSIGKHLDLWATSNGTDAVLRRLTVASTTPASIAEVTGLSALLQSPRRLHKLQGSTDLIDSHWNQEIDDIAGRLLGDIPQRFGVASLKEIPAPERKRLPAATSVMGVINLATEIATHDLRGTTAAETLAKWWNNLMRRSYHLEGAAHDHYALPARWKPAAQMA